MYVRYNFLVLILELSLIQNAREIKLYLTFLHNEQSNFALYKFILNHWKAIGTGLHIEVKYFESDN